MAVSFAPESAGYTRTKPGDVEEHVVDVVAASSLARPPLNTLSRGLAIARRSVAEGKEGFLAVLAACKHAGVSNRMHQCLNFFVLNVHIPAYLGSRGKPLFETSKFFGVSANRRVVQICIY